METFLASIGTYAWFATFSLLLPALLVFLFANLILGYALVYLNRRNYLTGTAYKVVTIAHWVIIFGGTVGIGLWVWFTYNPLPHLIL